MTGLVSKLKIAASAFGYAFEDLKDCSFTVMLAAAEEAFSPAQIGRGRVCGGLAGAMEAEEQGPVLEDRVSVLG